MTPERVIRWSDVYPEDVETVKGPEEVTIFVNGEYLTDLQLETWEKLGQTHPDGPKAATIAAIQEELSEGDDR